MNSYIICNCSFCIEDKRPMIYDAGEKDAYELPAETVNLIFCSVFASKNMGKNKCEVCDCTECECISVDVSEPLLRTKK